MELDLELEQSSRISVVIFSTLAGYAFAKLRFKGRERLMIFVIATMAVPTQLGVVPLFILLRSSAGPDQIGAVIVPTLVDARSASSS